MAAVAVGRVEWPEDHVDGREEDALEALSAYGATLGDADGIVDKDIKAPQGLGGQPSVVTAVAWGLWDRCPGSGRGWCGGRCVWRQWHVGKVIEAV